MSLLAMFQRKQSLIVLGCFVTAFIYLNLMEYSNTSSIRYRIPDLEQLLDREFITEDVPEWQKQCRFKEHFLIPLYKSSLNNTRDVKITLVSEFFEVNEAVRLNIENNIDHGRFLYVIGDSLKTLDKLISIAPPEISMEVYYAPGGVDYRQIHFCILQLVVSEAQCS